MNLLGQEFAKRLDLFVSSPAVDGSGGSGDGVNE